MTHHFFKPIVKFGFPASAILIAMSLSPSWIYYRYLFISLRGTLWERWWRQFLWRSWRGCWRVLIRKAALRRRIWGGRPGAKAHRSLRGGGRCPEAGGGGRETFRILSGNPEPGKPAAGSTVGKAILPNYC